MKRIAIPVSILALAALGACSNTPNQSIAAHTAPIVPQNVAYRTGFGTVDSVVIAPSPMGASRGGTATGASSHPAGTSATDRPEPRVGTPSSSAGRLNRLTIRMDDGSTQYIDTDSNEFPKGTRVELTPDRLIRKAG
jgi:outer membrane lipoprotein SlyB